MPPTNSSMESLGSCPFCGRKIYNVRDGKGEPVGVGHTMPQCEKFKSLQADEFVTAVVRARGLDN